MTDTIITEEQDPLATPLPAEPVPVIVPVQPAVAVVTQPAPTPANTVKYFDAFLDVTDTTVVSDLDISQRLPNILVSDEDLETCFKLCQEELIKNKGVPAGIKTVKEVIDAFYQISVNTQGDNYVSFFERNIEALVQYVTGTKGAAIRIGYPSVTLSGDDETISGKTALRYINRVTKTGNVTKIPLWHSGLVLTIDPFSEQELLDLNLTLARQQLTLGQDTRGASFTGDDIHVVGPIIDLILSKVVECNLKTFDRTSLHKLILAPDVNALMAGALAAIYPSGYPVFHPCVNTAQNLCSYNITAKRKDNNDFYPDSLLDFTKLLWVDNSILTLEETTAMSAVNRSTRLEDITSYQLRLTSKMKLDGIKSAIVHTMPGTNDQIEVTFKTPNLAEYSKISNTWVATVKRMAEAALNAEDSLSEDERKDRRNKILNSYAKITDLVKHTCWVNYISIIEASGVRRTIVDEASIKETLEGFTSIDGFKEEFDKAAQKYKEASLIAWTGIPNFECPECHTGQTSPDSKHPSLIPINMAGYFFSTLVWRRQMRQHMD
jgi:hypothetical protein